MLCPEGCHGRAAEHKRCNIRTNNSVQLQQSSNRQLYIGNPPQSSRCLNKSSKTLSFVNFVLALYLQANCLRKEFKCLSEISGFKRNFREPSECHGKGRPI